MKKKVSVVVLVVMTLSLVIGLVACSDSDRIISFETNNGTIIEDVTFTKGEAPDLSNIKPIKSGYVFEGWYFDQDFTKPYDKNNVPKDSFKVYAKYRTLNNYVVRFNSNGGTNYGTINVEEGSIINISNYMPIKYDHNFEGWYLDEALTDQYINQIVDKDITLYAKWTRLDQVTIVFNTNGGEELANKVFKTGEAPDLSNVIPTKYKYRFEGWYFDSALTKPYNKDQAPNDSFVLYAKYSYIKGKAEFMNSLRATLGLYNLDKGFNVNLTGDIKFDFDDVQKDIYNWNYGFIIEGNFFNENKLGNQNMSIKIVDKTNQNKVIFGLTNIKNDLYIEMDNLSYKIEGFNISALAMHALKTDMLPEGTNLGNIQFNETTSMNDVIDMMDLALTMMGSTITLDWVDGVYTYSFEVGPTINRVVSLIKGVGIQIPSEVDNLLNSLIAQKVAVNLITTEDENQMFNDFDIDVVIKNDDPKNNGEFNSSSNILIGKINEDFIPSEPLNAIVFNFFKHSAVTNFEFKNSEGISIGKYSFNFNMEFDHTTLQDAIIEALDTNSLNPILANIFSNQAGKIYIDLSHVCDETCALGHLGNAPDNHGSLLTIAYDPSLEGFASNRLFVAVDLRMVLTQDLLNILPAEISGLIGGIIAPENMKYLAISLDLDTMQAYSTLSPLAPKAPIEPENPGEGEVPQEPSEPNQGPTVQDITNLISTLVNSITANENTWTIQFADIWGAIKPIIPQNAVTIADQIVNSLMLNVNTIEGTKTIYQNESNIDFNVKDKFLQKNDTTLKEFNVGGATTSKKVEQIKGSLKAKLDDNGNIITNSEINLYDENGNITITLDELYAFIEARPTIDIEYTGLNGELISSKSIISEIRGFNPSKINEMQEVNLVLVKGVGDNFWDWMNKIGGIVKVIEPKLEVLATVALPQALIPLNITVTDGVSVEWTQDGIATQGMAFDKDKIYTAQDTFNTQFYLIQNYSNGAVKKTLVNSLSTDKLTSVEANSSKLKYYANFEMTYKYLDYTQTLGVKVKEYNASQTLNGKVGKALSIDKLVCEGIDGKIKYAFSDVEVKNALTEFVAANEGKVTLKAANIITPIHKLTFSEAGEYKLNLVVQGVNFNLTLSILEDSVQV